MHNNSTDTRENGQTLAEYALLIALVGLTATAVLLALGPTIGESYQNIIDSLASQPAEEVTVQVLDDNGAPAEGVYVYQFTGAGEFTGEYGLTDAAGEKVFTEVESGTTYQYLAYQLNRSRQLYYFWSKPIQFPQESNVTIHTQAHTVVVTTLKQNGKPLKNSYVYAMTANGRYYAGTYGRTNNQGQVEMNIAAGEYKFRVYHQGQYFWSDTVAVPEQTAVTINTRTEKHTLTIVDGYGNPLRNVRIYVYTENGAYIGLTGTSNKQGIINFNLAHGRYKFRADYYGAIYWSDPVDSSAGSSSFPVLP